MTETPEKKPNLVRRMYDWVLGWAEKPYGIWVLAFLSFCEASFFPIPPDVLLIALVMGSPKKWFRMALACSAASIVGALAGYWIGWSVWSQVSDWFFSVVPGFTPEKFARVQGLYQEWDFWVVFTAGFTPIPFKIITITAGVASLNLPMFIIASALSRSARFFLVAGLLRKFGPKIKPFIDEKFNLLAMLFTALLIGGVVILKYAL